MTPVDAQKTKTVHIKHFLSDSEILDIQTCCHDLQEAGVVAQEQRNPSSQPSSRIGSWCTTYLHTDGAFRARFPKLHEKMRQAFFEVDAQEWSLLQGRDPERLNFRTVEYHEYGPEGQLTVDKHYDAGSLITLDIMLSDPRKDFEGGDLIMPEEDGRCTVQQFSKGDAVFFVSHKYHNVRPVKQGLRVVLVVELWDGPERACAHRCRSVGSCCHRLDASAHRT